MFEPDSITGLLYSNMNQFSYRLALLPIPGNAFGSVARRRPLDPAWPTFHRSPPRRRLQARQLTRRVHCETALAATTRTGLSAREAARCDPRDEGRRARGVACPRTRPNGIR